MGLRYREDRESQNKKLNDKDNFSHHKYILKQKQYLPTCFDPKVEKCHFIKAIYLIIKDGGVD